MYRYKLFVMVDSCCGAVGRAAASNTRDPQFKYLLRQITYLLIRLLHKIEKTKMKKMKKKRPGLACLKKNYLHGLASMCYIDFC